jgi:hypothetical protein
MSAGIDPEGRKEELKGSSFFVKKFSERGLTGGGNRCTLISDREIAGGSQGRVQARKNPSDLKGTVGLLEGKPNRLRLQSEYGKAVESDSDNITEKFPPN